MSARIAELFIILIRTLLLELFLTTKIKILLCKRGIEPRYGLWTLPAGFLENGESLNDGAKRETKEETRADVEMGMIYSIFNIPQINQIYVIHLATLKDLSFDLPQKA